jgi:hypothetical protein
VHRLIANGHLGDTYIINNIRRDRRENLHQRIKNPRVTIPGIQIRHHEALARVMSGQPTSFTWRHKATSSSRWGIWIILLKQTWQAPTMFLSAFSML